MTRPISRRGFLAGAGPRADVRMYRAEGQRWLELRAFRKYNGRLARAASGRSKYIPAPAGEVLGENEPLGGLLSLA